MVGVEIGGMEVRLRGDGREEVEECGKKGWNFFSGVLGDGDIIDGQRVIV